LKKVKKGKNMDKFDLIVDRIEDLKDSTNQRLDSIDENLAEHMRRTDVLEEMHVDNKKRIENLETPGKARKYIVTTAIHVSAILGAILTVLKIIDMYK
jgi:hypothetical protein